MTSRIVIIGGGFAGVKCARTLRKARRDIEIVLFNRDNHMVFQPLLADVVGSALNPRAVAAPLRQMLKGVRCRSDEIVDIEADANEVRYRNFHGERKTLGYDELVIAVGNRVDLSRVPGMASHALPLKTIGDAIALRARVMERLEQADSADDPELRRWLASFVVIGGGFSGVEVAGEINDLVRHARHYYPGIGVEEMSVTLIHSRDQILPEVTGTLRDFALKRMMAAGVQFVLDARAALVSHRGVQLQDGRTVEGATVVCTVGNTAHELFQRLDLPKEGGRIKADAQMRVCGRENLWAIGDCALIPNAWDGELSPPTAQFAERQGRQAALNVLRKLRGEPLRPFSFKPVGVAAGIGSRSAVAELYGVRMSGFAAWWLWRSAFLVKLPSMLQKIKVGIDWAWEVVFPRDISHFRPGRTQPVSDAFFAQGETVIDESSCHRRLYVIQSGECEVVEEREGRPVRVLVVLGRGEMVGRQTLRGFGSGASIKLRARTNTEVVTLADDFLEQVSGLLKPLQQLVQRATLSHEDYWKNMPAALAELESRRCGELMRPVPGSAFDETMTVPAAFRQLHQTAAPFGLVCGTSGDVVGIVTPTDLIRSLRDGAAARLQTAMTRDPLCVTSADPASAAATTMQDHGLKWLPVVDGSGSRRPVGTLYAQDLLATVIDRI